MILDKIQKPNDIHKVALDDFPILAEEIREFLIEAVSETGGHLASNLGTVELTMALHNVLHFPEDILIWDVGHQAYTHKILTGRKEEFSTLRQEGGLSGFPKRRESPCDSFDAGHSSNSISAGLGYVRARDLLGEHNRVVCVIGDGALTGGEAFEALNNAGELKSNFIVVLNDNEMSISTNVGGVSTYLSGLRTAESYADMKARVEKGLRRIPGVGEAMVVTAKRTKSSIKQLFIPGMFFEEMGLTYLGPVDGHNMLATMKLLNEAKRVEGPVLVHVHTKKGCGYGPAKAHPDRFHGTGPFDIATGRQKAKKGGPTYTDVFSRAMVDLGKKEERLVAVTAAMPGGTGLSRFKEAFPSRFFDVGIAEGHAVSFAAGLALGGLVPVVAIYSSFLQRAFDQILMDVCMQSLHVIFAIDRAGLVGADGETHQGLFDLSYLSVMPGMTVMAPSSGEELKMMLRFALSLDGPVAIRYSKDTAASPEGEMAPLEMGKAQVLRSGRDVAILAVGNTVESALLAAGDLARRGYAPTVVNVRFVKPFDEELLRSLCERHSLIVTVEENELSGGFGLNVGAFLREVSPMTRHLPIAVRDRFVEQGSVSRQREQIGLDRQGIARQILLALKLRGE